MTDELHPLDDDIAALLGASKFDAAIPSHARSAVSSRLSSTLGFTVTAAAGASLLVAGSEAAAAGASTATGLATEGTAHVVTEGAALAAKGVVAAKAAGVTTAAVSTATATSVAATTGVAAATTTTAATVAASTGLFAALAKPIVIGSFVAGTFFGGGAITVVDKAIEPAPRVVYVPAPSTGSADLAAGAVVDDDDNVDVIDAADATKATKDRAVKRPKKVVTKTAPALTVEDDGRGRELSRERALLEMARTALSRGEAREARRNLENHRARFPNGKLAEERDALLVLALVGDGNLAEAKRLADEFERKFPGSLLMTTVRSAVSSTP